MVRFLNTGMLAGAVLASQSIGLAAETVSIAIDGTLDLETAFIDDTALLDGDDYRLNFDIDLNAITARTDVDLSFSATGVSVIFDAFYSLETANPDAVERDVFELNMSGQTGDVLFDLFVDIPVLVDSNPRNFSFDPDGRSVFSGSTFTFGGADTPLGQCKPTAPLFCGVDFDTTNASIAFASDSDSITPVPLPAGFWFLAAGLGLLGASRYRQAS